MGTLLSFCQMANNWSECIYNLITAVGFSAMFTFQLDNTKRKTLPAPHCRNGSCRYVRAWSANQTTGAKSLLSNNIYCGQTLHQSFFLFCDQSFLHCLDC